MQIRAANPEDVPDVLPMVARTCALHERLDASKYAFRDNPAEMYRRWLASRATDPRSVFFVAQREDRLIGFLVGTTEPELPIYRLTEYGFIHDVWVDEPYRNEGVARQMVMLAIERFKQIGVRQVRLDVAVQNEPARALFASCGFRPAVVEMIYVLND